MAAKMASPDLDLSAQVRDLGTAELTARDIGVGGDGDSIALWLAILSLGGSPLLGSLLYQFGFRRVRLWRENGNKYIKALNGGRVLCVECRQSENWNRTSGPSPSLDSSESPSSSSLDKENDPC